MMKHKIFKYSISAAAAAILFSAISCSSPVAPRLTQVQTPETNGIVTDTDSGLVAGLSLDGDDLLDNPAVVFDSENNNVYEWADGLSGQSSLGNEDGDLIRLDNEMFPQMNTEGSMEVWVQPRDDDDDPSTQDNYWTGIIHKGEKADFSDESWSLQFEGERMPMFFAYCAKTNDDGSITKTSVWINPKQSIPLDQWTHLAVTWQYVSETDTITFRFYINGSEVSAVEKSGIGSIHVTDSDYIIGSQVPEEYNATYGHLTFTGLIDEVSLYNVVRTPDQILADYQKYESEITAE
jgi:hypothetical protein